MLVAERAVELAQQIRAEAGGKRRARQIDNVADALEADARQRRHGHGRKPQRGERQRRQQLALLAIGITLRFADMRGGPGGANSSGNGKRIGEASPFDALAEIGDQRRFAAIKMRAAGDVEQQAVGRIAGDQRRVAQAPVGDFFQQLRVGLGVFLHGVELRMHGARLRQRHAGGETAPLRRLIDGDQQVGIAAFAVDDCRFIPPTKGGGWPGAAGRVRG